MSRIYVEFSGLDQVGTRCKTVASKVDSIQSDFMQIVCQLDWDIRFEADINKTATQISRKLEQYSKILESYQQFIGDAYKEYSQLNEYKRMQIRVNGYVPSLMIVGPGASTQDFINNLWENFWKRYGPINVIKSFGTGGKIVGIFDSFNNAITWNEWANIGLNIGETIYKIATDYNHYTKIGRAIGTANARSNFLKNMFGFRKVGYASIASSFKNRFYNNLHNTTSAYNLKDSFAPLTGAKGVAKTVVAWAGVVLTGISNAFSNIDEQKNSNGKMSTERVVAETISETTIDTLVTYGGGAIVGAAITAVTGVVAAPVVVAIATGAVVAGINAGVETLTEKSATEWVSDAILDHVTGL